MAELLQVVESIRAEAASVQRLFGGEGQRVRRARNNPVYLARLAEAVTLYSDVMAGRQPVHRLQEAMTTSDFPLLMGDILDRQLLANYREAPYSWNLIAKRGTVSDFRTVKRFAVNGAESTLSAVAQQAEYPEASLSEASYSYSVTKYGRRIPFSWEAMINDDLQALKDIPMRFGKAARRTEQKFVTGLYVDVNGPHASFYTSGNKNQVKTANGASADNPPLSIGALQDAFVVLSKMVDVDGEPITIEAITLIVPPALEVTALNILNATELWLNAAGGLSNQQVHVVNWMKNRVKLAVDYYIPLTATTANGSTSWFLFANPDEGRPAIEVGFLRGHEEPEIFMKTPNAQRVGGGEDPMNGDFDTDSLEYKIRHVLGGTRMDPKMTVASNGSGA